MTGFTVSPAARSDLRKIWRYTAENWSGSQADRYISVIEASFQGIASGTNSGRSASDFRPGYLRISIESHYVFYRLGSSGRVEVMRVLHQRMNLTERLKEI